MSRTNRYANGHRRRRVRAEVFRTEDTCWRCGLPVEKSLGPYQPDSPEIDEVIPVRFGGSPYQRENCRLSHRRCNVARNRTRPRPVITAYRSTRTW